MTALWIPVHSNAITFHKIAALLLGWYTISAFGLWDVLDNLRCCPNTRCPCLHPYLGLQILYQWFLGIDQDKEMNMYIRLVLSDLVQNFVQQLQKFFQGGTKSLGVYTVGSRLSEQLCVTTISTPFG